MHASGSGGQTRFVFFYIYLALPPFELPGTAAEGETFDESLQLAGLVSTTVGREGEHAEICFIVLPSFEIFGAEIGM